MTDLTQQAISLIEPVAKQLCEGGLSMKGMILGSGLHSLTDQFTDTHIFSYADLPGFPQPSVEGHAGQLILGKLAGKPVACLAGRVHYYEGDGMGPLHVMMKTLKGIGCDELILTNASGSINAEIPAGSVIAITDHINFSFNNPLVGLKSSDHSERFVPMDNAYDRECRERMHRSADALGFTLYNGVYIGVLGPSFETPAEIRAFRTLGADCIGMSTVADVILARQTGLKVVALAAVVNQAADLKTSSITHEETLEYGAKTAKTMIPLIAHYVEHG